MERSRARGGRRGRLKNIGAGKGARKEREANDVDLKRGARQLDGAGREDATPRAATLTHRVYLARVRHVQS